MVVIKLKKDFGKYKLDIEFSTESRRIGILGASGSGKSLTLKMIAGIEPPDQGFISVDGNILFDTENKINKTPQKRNIGYLFQNYALFPSMTVEQNIASGIKGKKKYISEKTSEMIEKFQLTGLEKRYPRELSGGQQQRCAIARIIAYEPDVILLDEPFSALDVYLRDEMLRELIEILNEYTGTVILVSHNRDEIYKMSDELIVIDNGSISVQGNTKKIFKNPRTFVSARLTGCKNIANVVNVDNGIYISDWNITLPVYERNIKAVAIRAHEFTEESDDFCFNIFDPVVTEDLFEYNISFKASAISNKRINWKISKSNFNGMPHKIYLNKKNLLFIYF